MGVTSLKRKARRNRVVAKQRLQGIKLVTVKPVIRKVDIEDVKEEFKNSEKKAPAKKEEKPVAVEEVKTETVAKVEDVAPKVEKQEAPAPKAEKKEAAPKKAPAKKKKEE